MISSDEAIGVAFRFAVVIDGYNLGSWTTCKGLAVTFKYDIVKELGEHTMSAYLPGRVEYGTISLQRAMTASGWSKTKEWLQIVASSPWLATDVPIADTAFDAGGEISFAAGGNGVEFGGNAGAGAGLALTGPSSGTIVMVDAHLAEVARWDLQHVLPAAWKGPQFDANGKLVAIETLDLVHEGFLVCANF